VKRYGPYDTYKDVAGNAIEPGQILVITDDGKAEWLADEPAESIIWVGDAEEENTSEAGSEEE
jgi:hypothetical protein